MHVLLRVPCVQTSMSPCELVQPLNEVFNASKMYQAELPLAVGWGGVKEN